MFAKGTHDVRVVLVRDKYFSLQPKPLQQWLWKQGVARSAERVFWLHWEAGHLNGTWCSEIPLKRVAAECCLDVSTVTRAYQHLTELGLIRRQDPGRDPRNPFQQATAVTEVRVPRELVCELNRFPDRRSVKAQEAVSASESGGAKMAPTAATVAPDPPKNAEPRLSIREGLRRLNGLQAAMNAAEIAAFSEAQRTQSGHMKFAEDTGLSAEQRAEVLSWLGRMAAKPAGQSEPARDSFQGERLRSAGNRALGVFDLARARRELQSVVVASELPEVLRQVAWSVEKGALRRFAPRHALNIALKKVRSGEWLRPHRMPPNWMLSESRGAVPVQCRSA